MSLTGEGGQTANMNSTGDASCRRPCAQTQVARAGRPRDRVDSARARHHGRRIGGLSIVTVEAIAILLLFEGFLALALFTLAPHRRGYIVLVKALALIVLGCMILDFPVQVDIENSVLFGLAFLIDGGSRIATASVVRFPSGS